MQVKIIQGDSLATLKMLSDNQFNACVTSPPYFWARCYGVDGQYGHENTVDEYVSKMGDVFDEVKRVLRNDGVLWLNLGDSYYSGNGQPTGSDPKSPSRNFMRNVLRPLDQSGWPIPKKSLLGIPWLVAHELQRRGWTLRSDVIWCKPKAFTEASVRDRPRRQHEYLFLLSKSRRYWFDRSSLPEESVWHISHERGNPHSAAFPEELARRCILSGSPDGGSILDPFGGSGTTGFVARSLGRSATLIELSPDFIHMAEARISSTLQPNIDD